MEQLQVIQSKVYEIRGRQVKELKDYMEEVFADCNDINDDTRMQLELINQTLAELQVKSWKKIRANESGSYTMMNNSLIDHSDDRRIFPVKQ